nr:MAG TPA: hypothetical protein [Caudoviricetes sp.]
MIRSNKFVTICIQHSIKCRFILPEFGFSVICTK